LAQDVKPDGETGRRLGQERRIEVRRGRSTGISATLKAAFAAESPDHLEQG